MSRTRGTGFTLLESLVIVVIFGLLAGYVLPQYFSKTRKSEIDAVKTQLGEFDKALAQYHLDTGHLPTTEQGLEALVERPAEEPKWMGPYLSNRVPLDPWKRPYGYRSSGERSGFDLYSYGKDGTPGGSGANADTTMSRAFTRPAAQVTKYTTAAQRADARTSPSAPRDAHAYVPGGPAAGDLSGPVARAQPELRAPSGPDVPKPIRDAPDGRVAAASGGAPAARLNAQVPKEAALGESFTVTVNLVAEMPLRAGSFKLNFDESRVRVTKVEEGDLLKRRPQGGSFNYTVEDEVGRLTVTYAAAEPVRGNERLASITFRVVAPAAGASRFMLTEATGEDAAGSPLSVAAAAPVTMSIR